MSAGEVVFISGAAGINAAAINGVYDRTSETSGGYAVYAKRGDGGICMEHFEGTKSWQVKAVSNKGTATCKAYVPGGCAAEACTSRQWMVSFDGKPHSAAPLVKMVAGAEAQRQVAHQSSNKSVAKALPKKALVFPDHLTGKLVNVLPGGILPSPKQLRRKSWARSS